MSMEVKDEEKKVVCHAINHYLDDLRQEIVRTESHDMKADLRREKELLQSFSTRC